MEKKTSASRESHCPDDCRLKVLPFLGKVSNKPSRYDRAPQKSLSKTVSSPNVFENLSQVQPLDRPNRGVHLGRTVSDVSSFLEQIVVECSPWRQQNRTRLSERSSLHEVGLNVGGTFPLGSKSIRQSARSSGPIAWNVILVSV